MENTNIYFIGSVELGAIKIGKSNNPEKRLVELQTGNPYKLVLFGIVEDVTPDYETKLHRVMDHLRLEGEWFKLTNELLHFMINRKEETSVAYRFRGTTKSKTQEDLLSKIIDELVVFSGDSEHFMREWRLMNEIKKYLVTIEENSHFDIKDVIRLMELKGNYRTKDGNEYGYSYHYLNKDTIPKLNLDKIHSTKKYELTIRDK